MGIDDFCFWKHLTDFALSITYSDGISFVALKSDSNQQNLNGH
jgi:hypothetical protein